MITIEFAKKLKKIYHHKNLSTRNVVAPLLISNKFEIENNEILDIKKKMKSLNITLGYHKKNISLLQFRNVINPLVSKCKTRNPPRRISDKNLKPLGLHKTHKLKQLNDNCDVKDTKKVIVKGIVKRHLRSIKRKLPKILSSLKNNNHFLKKYSIEPQDNRMLNF